ncbi:MAG: hypothetical protein D6780_01215, partial [Candidatus Dadabacteria bacterium]
ESGTVESSYFRPLSFSGTVTIREGTSYAVTEKGIVFKERSVIFLAGTLEGGTEWKAEINNVSSINYNNGYLNEAT